MAFNEQPRSSAQTEQRRSVNIVGFMSPTETPPPGETPVGGLRNSLISSASPNSSTDSPVRLRSSTDTTSRTPRQSDADPSRGTYRSVLSEVSAVLALPPDERVTNLERFARCVTVIFRRRALSQEDIDLRRLMPSSLSKNEDVWEYTSCAICLTDFADGEELRRLPCSGGHYFHPTCLRGWLERSHASCPLCRGGEEEVRGGAVPLTARPSADALAEYICRRMRSGRTENTVSAANQAKADQIVNHMREQVRPVEEESDDGNNSQAPPSGPEKLGPLPELLQDGILPSGMPLLPKASHRSSSKDSRVWTKSSRMSRGSGKGGDPGLAVVR
eukprot:gnl/TRDRNA2_/TRDRNA2_36772_c0_seq1.p1 gnl/TRDRNA2_/TRDRNA2_36772_c0~~gnl/TRDRNA2_/TRDRNA2_36772_c0_seq1.p1  ORF type:complete len:348 (+),score=48.70 gnl/TRDRNA2_/TRDRNA2_36772_c0_seq1:53-1045(+)